MSYHDKDDKNYQQPINNSKFADLFLDHLHSLL